MDEITDLQVKLTKSYDERAEIEARLAAAREALTLIRNLCENVAELTGTKMLNPIFARAREGLERSEIKAVAVDATYEPKPGWYGVWVCSGCQFETIAKVGESISKMQRQACPKCGNRDHLLSLRQEAFRAMWEYPRGKKPL